MEAVTPQFNWYTFIRDTFLIVATLSAAVYGYFSYRRQKREDRATAIREMLIKYDNNCNVLNHLLTFDVVHEIVSCVIYSKIIHRNLHRMNHMLTNSDLKIGEIDKERFSWPWPITIPLHSQLVDDYEATLRKNQEICATLGTQLPSLYKVFLCVHNIFWSILADTKEFVRNEEILGEMWLETTSITGPDIDLQKDEIFNLMIASILKGYNVEQKNIDDAIALLKLVNQSFLKLDNKQLEKQRKLEQKMTWGKFGSKSSIFEEFQESEKAFEKIMSRKELLKFRELYTKIQVRKEG